MKQIFTALLCFCFSGVFAQNWSYIGSDVSGGKYYIRVNGTTEYGYQKAWTKTIKSVLTYYKAGRNYTLTNGHCIDLNECDCKNRRYRVSSYVYYNSKGILVHTYNVPSYAQEWSDVVPDSVGEAILEAACENVAESNSSGPLFSSSPAYSSRSSFGNSSDDLSYSGQYLFKTKLDRPVEEPALFSAPSLNSREVCKIPKQATIYVIDNTGDLFWKIYVNGYTGYLSKNWLQRQW